MNYIIVMALCNMLGGRWEDVWGEKFFISSRMFWRGIMPGIATGFLAGELFNVWIGLYVWGAVTAGSMLWFPFNWSFEEITGESGSTKYPTWIRWIGVNLLPLNESIVRNQQRGMLMKGIRGMYDILTFAALLPINKFAMLFWLATFAMGPIYRGVAYLTPGGKQDVMVSELVYGAWRGLLLWLVLITTAIYNFMWILHL